MSSGSKEAVLGLVILCGSIAFTAQARPPAGAAARRPVHLTVAPPAEDAAAVARPRTLRVCADPNNLPFSNDRGEGFENAIAEAVAGELGWTVTYHWQPQRRGFIRTALRAGLCDVVIGIPTAFDRTRVTRPYYRSAFMLVSRRDRGLRVRSLDDPRLRRLRIGIEITGQDYSNPPAAMALAARHIVDNVRGYMVFGNYATAHPSWGVMEAVDRGDVDVAIAWGPLAGYYARHAATPLDLTAVPSETRPRSIPFAFDISMGVRPQDGTLAAALDWAIVRRAAEIGAILRTFGIPVVPRQEVQG